MSWREALPEPKRLSRGVFFVPSPELRPQFGDFPYGIARGKFSLYFMEGVVNPDRWSDFVARRVIRVKDMKRCRT